MDCYAVPLDIEWPNLRLALVTVSALAKPVSSREGMQRTAATSTLYDGWPRLVKDDMARLTEAIKSRDLDLLGSVAERNALAMHGTMLGADPPLIYWHPGTLETLQRVAGMRGDGCRLYATIDAGPNVKLLFEARDEDTIRHAFPGARVVAPFAHPETFTEPRDRPRIKYRSQPT